MSKATSGQIACPFPNQSEEPEHAFKKAGRLLEDINVLRVLMFKQQGIDFTPQKYAENAHGHFEDGFDYKLGFRKAPHNIDPVFDMIASLKIFSSLYVRSDDTIRHPYPHEIFIKKEELDDLILLIAHKTKDLDNALNKNAPKPALA